MGKHKSKKPAPAHAKVVPTTKTGTISFCSPPKANPALQIHYVSKPFPPAVAEYFEPNFKKIQTYFSSLEKIFTNLAPGKSNGYLLNCGEWIHDISGFSDPYRFQGSVGPLDISGSRVTNLFLKRAHLLEPISYMKGDYVLPEDGALPSYQQAWQHTLAKINDPMNEAYVDALFAVCASRLVEQKLSPHWVRCHGTFCARIESHSYNLTEDYDDINEEPWFAENLAAGLFELRVLDDMGDAMSFKPHTAVKPRRSVISDTSMNFGDDDSCEDLDAGATNSPILSPHDSDDSDELEEADLDLDDMAAEAIVVTSTKQTNVRLHKKSNSIVSSDSHESDDGNNADDEGEDENDSEYSEGSSGPPIIALFKNFPVMVTMLECCDGTMDLLLDEQNEKDQKEVDDTKELRWTAWIFQVIAALAVAQKQYHFVHNDLHTNNIMWSWTADTTLYYNLKDALGGSRYYAVPTFGRIFKIIDFNRASFHLGKRGGFFISDAFGQDGDASGQYNCPPYYNQKQNRIDPNPSFDLCRLACSLLESLYDEDPAPKEPKQIMTEEPDIKMYETQSPLFNLLWSWLQQKDGYNVLRNADGSERFPGFNLYHIIAHHVANAVPCEQITKPIFDSKYQIEKKDIPAGEMIWELPCTV